MIKINSINVKCINGDLQKAGGYYPKYRFTGKEVDEETGLYYFGARYYDPRISLWYGVDPKADEYPGWSPFNYTLNNPVRLIDPDGKGPTDFIYLFYKNAPGSTSFSGHRALFIGNDKTGYTFFNITGNENKITHNAELVKMKFNSLDEFNKNVNGGDGSSYPFGYRIKISEKQDNEMINEENKGDYRPYDIGINENNKCADFNRCVSDAGNIENGDRKSFLIITIPKKDIKNFVELNPGGTFELFGPNSKRTITELGINLPIEPTYKLTVTDENLR